MRRWIVAFMLVALVVSLSACGAMSEQGYRDKIGAGVDALEHDLGLIGSLLNARCEGNLTERQLAMNDEYTAKISKTLAELRKVEPPEKYARAQEVFVQGLDYVEMLVQANTKVVERGLTDALREELQKQSANYNEAHEEYVSLMAEADAR